MLHLANSAPLRVVLDRLRFLAIALLCIFAVGWIAWFAPYDDLLDRSGTPLGADFSMFYVAGQIVADGELDQLYDQAEHQRRLHRLFPTLSPGFCLPYRYPPAVAWCAAPLTRLPYPLAFAIFTLCSGFAAAAGVWQLRTSSRLLNGTCASISLLTLAAAPVVLETVIGGQASLISFAIAAAVVGLLPRRPEWAGAILALGLFKPNVLPIFAVGCVVANPRLLRGAVPTLIGMLLFTIPFAGWQPLFDYVEVSTSLASRPWEIETPPWKVHSLAAYLPSSIPHAKLWLTVFGTGVAAWLALRWRRQPDPAAIYRLGGQLLIVQVLCNIYLPIYDLTLLVLAAFCLIETASRTISAPELTLETALSRRAHCKLQAVLACVYFGPHLSQALAPSLGIQFFPFLVLFFALTHQGWTPIMSTPPETTHLSHLS